MFKISVKNLKAGLISFIIGTILSVPAFLLPINTINIDIILFIVSAYAIFLILNLFIYSKIPTLKTLIISTLDLTLFSVSSGISISIADLISKKPFSFLIDINIAFALTVLLTIFLTMFFAIKTEIIDNTKDEIAENDINFANFKQEIKIEKKLENFDTNIQEVYKTVSDTIKEEAEPELLAELPNINLEEDNNLQLKELEDINPEKSSTDYIPVDARLKKLIEHQDISSSKIPFLGKVLINERDMENIIESNALMQVISSKKSSTNIFTSIQGAELSDIINKIKNDVSEINNIMLFSKNGYVFTTNIEDKKQEQFLSAMYSGAFNLIEKYLEKINFLNIKSIFFELNNNFIMISNSSKGLILTEFESVFNYATFSQIDEFLSEAKELTSQDLFKNAIISTISGENKIQKVSNDSYNAIINAIFSNFNVLLNGIYNENLNKILITNENDFIIISLSNDKILSINADNQNFLKLSDKINNIRSLIEGTTY